MQSVTANKRKDNRQTYNLKNKFMPIGRIAKVGHINEVDTFLKTKQDVVELERIG